jgi:ATP-binding cassette subfamily F protein 3
MAGGFLNRWKGALLLVSHDRYFLDKVCNVIWDMFPDHIEVYHGNYSAYLEQRELRWQFRQNSFKAEKERMEKELAYVRRNIAAQNTTQAKGKLRRLSRQIEAIEQLGWTAFQQKNWLQVSQQVNTSQSMMSVEEAERRLRALTPPQDDRQPHPFHLQVKPQSRSGDIVLRAQRVVVGYPNKPLFYAENLLLRRKECAAILGANGTGKSTFLKTILQQLPPLEGEVQLGASLQIGYFAQTHEDLDPDCSLLEEISKVKPDWSNLQIRKHLARFLFIGDDVYKPIKVLSGGERSRLVLSKLMLAEPNFLLLDEPTNHLDIPSQELLQAILAEYTGTLLLVSHDRFLINLLATQLWEIKPSADHSIPKLEVFNGSYQEYLQHEDSLSRTQTIYFAAQSQEKKDYRLQKARKNRQLSISRKKQERLEEIEAAIEKLEAEQQELEEALAHPPTDYEALHQ